MKIAPSLRWCLIPIVAIAGCSGVTVAADTVGTTLHFAVSPTTLETALPLDVRTGFADGAAALAFVVAGAMIAPRSRLIVAMALCAVGAWVAWLVLGSWWFPENHPRAYQPSRMPLALTLLGGLIGVLITLRSARQGEIRRPHDEAPGAQSGDVR